MSARQPDTALKLRRISKSFGEIAALQDVDFDVHPQEVHALLGQNGAGKSTLMKILFGLYRADSGSIQLGDRDVTIRSPQDAIAAGLSFVQQHFALVERLSVAENIVLGASTGLTYRPRQLNERLQAFIDRNGFDLRARDPVAGLAMGQKQQIEILKALYRNARFIIFDEPTSVLAPAEITALFVTIRRLRAAGCGIVFISHKLKEVFAISDRITVLRDGRLSGSFATSATTAAAVAARMVGDLKSAFEAEAHPQAPGVQAQPLLAVRQLAARDDRGVTALRGVSFELFAGEIVGVAGVDGSGQRELAEVIAGLRARDGGHIEWFGGLAGSERRRIAFVPQDRSSEAFVADFSVAENFILEHSAGPPYARYGFLRPDTVAGAARAQIDSFAVQCKSPRQPIRELSGGNQQKLLIARALQFEPAVLIALHPTWGVDVHATALIHQRLRAMRARGGTVLFFSSDLDEIYALSDRFFVLHAGEVTGWGTAATSLQQAGLWMAGLSSQL